MKLLKEKESFSFNDHVENFFNSEQNYDEVIDKLFAMKKPSWMNTFFTDEKKRFAYEVI